MGSSSLVGSSFEHVYYAESTDRRLILNPIAIRPRINDTHILWEDNSGIKGRSFPYSNIKIVKMHQKGYPEEIEITCQPDDIVIKLYSLTLKLFNEKVKNRVGSPEFKSDEELQNFYLHTSFDQ